jgi:protein gp37
MKGLPTTRIPYATHAWGIATGCNEALPCADRCWAKADAARLANNPREEIARRYRGLVAPAGESSRRPREPAEPEGCWIWTGQINEFPEFLEAPVRLRDPAVIFVGTHTDLGLVSTELKCRIWGAMEGCPRHEFLVVTKRWVWLSQVALRWGHSEAWSALPNVTVCLSCSTQEQFDAEMTRAGGEHVGAWRGRLAAFLEPQLEPIDIRRWVRRLDWVVQGCESLGRGTPGRPFAEAWARETRRVCQDTGMPYWLKQMPGWWCAKCRQWTCAPEGCLECSGRQVRRLIHAPRLDEARSWQQAPARIANILEARGKRFEGQP